MSRWKSVFDEKSGILTRVPADASAHMEVISLEFREGRMSEADFKAKKAEIEKGFLDSKKSDKEKEDLRLSSQKSAREAVAKSQATVKASKVSASKARSAEKAKRKEVVKGGK